MLQNNKNYQQLRRLIDNYFNLNELRFLCHDLGIDFEHLPEGGKLVKIDELLLICGHANQQKALLKELAKARPGIAWPLDFNIPTGIDGGLSQREWRNRENLLNAVHTTWIAGVLQRSLSKEISLVFGLRYENMVVGQRVLQTSNDATQPVKSDQSLEEIFESFGRNLLILGAPGSGKTIALLQLAQVLIYKAWENPNFPMPIVLNLSSWGENCQSLENWLIEEMSVHYQIAKLVSKDWIEAGQLIYLLDGLDEVRNNYREDCVTAINNFQSTQMAEIVVCSRTEDYEQLSKRLNLASAVHIYPLNDEQIQMFLNQEEIAMKAVRVTLATDTELQKLAQSPLMLTIMTLAYRDLTLEDLKPLGSVEARRRHLFQHYVANVFTRRPLQNEDYNQSQALDWLANLGQCLFQNGQSIFQIERLQIDWLPQRRHNLYEVVAGGVGGLFVGLFTGILVGFIAGPLIIPVDRFLERFIGALIVGLIVGFVSSLGSSLGNWIGNLSINPLHRFVVAALSSWFVVLIFQEIIVLYSDEKVFRLILGLIVVPISGIIAYKTDIGSAELLTLSRLKIREFVVSVTKGTIGGLILGILLWFFSGLTTGLLEWFVIGFIGGMAGGAMTIIQARSTETLLIPNQGIRSSFKNALRISILVTIFALIFGWYLNLILDFYGLAAIMLVSILTPASFLYYGGTDFIHHITLRFMLKQYNILPFQLICFCDDMVERILLRRVGGGWIYIHRYLLEYFANLRKEIFD